MLRTIKTAAATIRDLLAIVGTTTKYANKELNTYLTDLGDAKQEVNQVLNMPKVELILSKLEDLESLEVDESSKAMLKGKLQAMLAKELGNKE